MRSAVSIQYTDVTDGQTDTSPMYISHYAFVLPACGRKNYGSESHSNILCSRYIKNRSSKGSVFLLCWLVTDFVLRTTNKSSAVAEMGDRAHNRHGPKR